MTKALQRWKLAILAVLAIPSAAFSPEPATGFGEVIGLVVMFVIATAVARKTGISEWFPPTWWKVMAGLSVIPAFYTAAMPYGMAAHGFGGAFLYLLVMAVVVKGLSRGKDVITTQIR